MQKYSKKISRTIIIGMLCVIPTICGNASSPMETYSTISVKELDSRSYIKEETGDISFLEVKNKASSTSDAFALPVVANLEKM